MENKETIIKVTDGIKVNYNGRNINIVIKNVKKNKKEIEENIIEGDFEVIDED